MKMKIIHTTETGLEIWTYNYRIFFLCSGSGHVLIEATDIAMLHSYIKHYE